VHQPLESRRSGDSVSQHASFDPGNDYTLPNRVLESNCKKICVKPYDVTSSGQIDMDLFGTQTTRFEELTKASRISKILIKDIKEKTAQLSACVYETDNMWPKRVHV
jgi:hypothetical protein